jgi:predicted metal-dependent hydrolase
MASPSKILRVAREGEREMTYTLRISTHTKRVSIRLERDGMVLLTLPRGCSVERGGAFFVGKTGVDRTSACATGATSAKTLSHEERREEYHATKAQALAVISSCVRAYAERYGFVYTSISIRAQTTRWGSCSSRGRLSFQYRLALIDAELMEYVVVHELVHTRFMHHGPAFWACVEEILPDYKSRRARLRKEGL